MGSTGTPLDPCVEVEFNRTGTKGRGRGAVGLRRDLLGGRAKRWRPPSQKERGLGSSKELLKREEAPAMQDPKLEGLCSIKCAGVDASDEGGTKEGPSNQTQKGGRKNRHTRA